MPRIPALPDFVGTVAADDEIPLYDTSADTTYGVTVADLAAAVAVVTSGVSEAPNTGTIYVRQSEAWVALPVEIMLAVSDETTAITTGTAKITFRVPHAMTLASVRANLNTASSSGLVTVDVNKTGLGSLFSTLLTIDANEKTSLTAATAAVLSTTSLSDDDEITIDIDGAGTGAKGLKVTFKGTRA